MLRPVKEKGLTERTEMKTGSLNKFSEHKKKKEVKAPGSPLSCPLSKEKDLTAAMAQSHTHDFLFKHYIKFIKIMLCGEFANRDNTQNTTTHI